MKALRTPLSALLASLLTGCIATAPRVDVVEPTQAWPAAPATPAIANGSLFQAAAYRPLYETPRARQVGDIVTINILEKVTAKQESTSSLEKAGSFTSKITAPFPFLTGKASAYLQGTGSTDNKFDGKGTTEATHNFSGTITTTVVQVLPNGHLIVSGEKQIGVNQNVEVLRFSGQIDPLTIQPGNTVSSSQVANVRVDQRGRGAQDEAQGIGWLARFFLTLSPL